MIECVLISSLSGGVLLSKYYNSATKEQKAAWEATLQKITQADWQNAKNEQYQVALYE